MNRSAKNAMLMALMLSSMGGMTGSGSNSPFDFDDEPIQPKKKPIPNGCKEYTFYGVTVVAINEASAIKKCKKKAGIK